MTVLHQGRRTFSQRFFTDPVVFFVWMFFWGLWRCLPVDAASWMGARLGGCAYYIARKKNRIALHNMRKCLPDKSEQEYRVILKKMWQHFGRMIAELPHLPHMGDRVTTTGEGHLLQMRDDNIGGFICGAHLGNFELAGVKAHQVGITLHPVYRAANNPWVEKYIYQKRRLTPDMQLIPKGISGARMMVDLLRKGEHIGLLCDQKMREGIMVPFFGYPAPTAPAIAHLSLKLKVPIFPASICRTQGAHYIMQVEPPLKIVETDDRNADALTLMTEVNRHVERWVKAYPEQWLWIHHRWPKDEYKD